MAKILITEDDSEFCDILAKFLKSYFHEVDTAHDAGSANELLRSFDYDLLILDLNLPDGSGQQVLRQLRDRGSKLLVLVLTGRHEIKDKTQLFETGADDYLTKPADLREVQLRVQALLRRKSFFQADQLKVGRIIVDLAQHQVEIDGQIIDLSRKEFQLLELFVRHPNVLLPPEFIFEHVWATESESNLDVVRTTVKRLRQKIDPEGNTLETIYGSGYVFKI
ncbi:MAG: response regulator transcription factor [Cyanobacteria bacterium SZAS LIN-5]|nr:response regulator transcription factor [Cyanobacteria bacterium SZAS LIN-5]RTL38515.1 MAG: response regulator transcription factor [Candidatus Melainabacteria bacterium]